MFWIEPVAFRGHHDGLLFVGDLDPNLSMGVQRMNIPTNAPELGQVQVDQIRSYQGNIRRNTLDLARLAYDIHAHHISSDGRKYDAAFEKWWNEHNVGSLFGTRGNWTHWHQAGEVISKVEARFSAHFTQLPMTVTALKAIAELTDAELTLCLQNTFKRSSLTQLESEWTRPKKPKPLINPSVSGATIRSWCEAWRNPKPKVKSDPRRVVLATIKMHGSFFNFDKTTAEHNGKIGKDEIRALDKKLNEIFGGQSEIILIDSNAERLCSSYDVKEKRATDAVARRAEKEKKKQKGRGKR